MSEQRTSKQSNDLVARLRHLEKYEWGKSSEDYGAQMTVSMGRECLAEIERLAAELAEERQMHDEVDAALVAEVDERDRLRAELARERQGWSASQQISELRDERDRMRAALEKYGRHHLQCGKFFGAVPFSKAECTCGLGVLLSGAADETTK